MLYVLFRGLARAALRWFYRDVTVTGAERVPRGGALLVAVNHPNALVDALVAVAVVPRRVTLTAKATLWRNPLLAPLLDGVGIVPLRRASDEAAPGAAAVDPSRNAAAFEAILATLERGGAVLLFPEGKSHSEPALAPLRSGLARIALQARDEHGVRGLRVAPIGLVFERKWLPRSRVLVQVGEPLALDTWVPGPGTRPAQALTAEVEARLRAVTLNFETAKEEARTLAVSRALAAAFEGDRPLGRADTPLTTAVAVAHRVEAARERLAAGGALPPRAEAFLARLSALRQLAARHGVLLEDAEIATGLAAGARFTVREGLLALAGAPLALWGALNHWLPLRLAWWIGRRERANPDVPAMRTIVAGLGLVLAFYALQTAVVWWLAGAWWALLYLASLPVAGVVQLRVRDRARRALRRARTYRRFRRDPALRARFAAELAWVREEAVALEQG